MKAILALHSLWAVVLALVWSPAKGSDAFDILLAVICYLWVLFSLSLFFRTRWAWWGSSIAALSVAIFMAGGLVRAFRFAAAGQLSTAADWPGWGVFLALFLPTLASLAGLFHVRRSCIRGIHHDAT